MKNSIVYLLLPLLLAACSHTRVSQDSATTAAQVDSLVDSKSFQFTAQSVQPLGSRSRMLSTLYFVRVDNNKLTVDLPYMGRAYSAPMNTAESPLRFESTDFDYSIEKNKKSRSLLIRPHGIDVQQLQFNIFDNGTTYLNVVSTSRQAISFNGYMQTLPVPKQTNP